MNDKTFLPFLRRDPSKPVEPRGTAVRVAQRPEPAIQKPMSPELGNVAFKRHGDKPRIHLAHVHGPRDETCFAFTDTIAEESMTRRERFALLFLGDPVTFRIVPGNIKADVPLVEREAAPAAIAGTKLFG